MKSAFTHDTQFVLFQYSRVALPGCLKYTYCVYSKCCFTKSILLLLSVLPSLVSVVDFAIVIYIVAINTVNPIFLKLLYVSDMETHQNLKSINFGEKR